jgi:hypothetical protein
MTGLLGEARLYAPMCDGVAHDLSRLVFSVSRHAFQCMKAAVARPAKPSDIERLCIIMVMSFNFMIR